MHPRIHLISAALAASLALPSPARAVNLVANGGFESGLSGWTTNGSVGATSASVYSGTWAALLASDTSAVSYSLATPSDVADITEFSFWEQSSAGNLSLVVLDYSDGSSSGDSVFTFDLGNTAWTRYDLTSALAAGKTLVGFTIYGNSSAATALDEVVLDSIAAVPEPATALLWTLGVAGLSCRLRRQRAWLKGDRGVVSLAGSVDRRWAR